MSYQLTGKAEEDVISIYLEGLKTFGEAQSERYHLELEGVFETIGHSPYLARERQDLCPPMRVHPHGSHINIYQVDAAKNVLIVRVRHAREDWVAAPIEV
ncbi:type II toxin-antitoxin system RelE/ParE family toxin [Roseibium album]|uniref:type II toxin-antitoxin system RelE/ParE family toxin n=1 Tax=Roseibium album TaxID=311410 RepID=UPI00329908CD